MFLSDYILIQIVLLYIVDETLIENYENLHSLLYDNRFDFWYFINKMQKRLKNKEIILWQIVTD